LTCLLVLLTAGSVMAQVVTINWPPAPGGSVSSAKSGPECGEIAYEVTATERDSTQVDAGPIVFVPDELVDVFPGYMGDNAPSGKVVMRRQADYDPTIASRRWDVTVRLRTIDPANGSESVADPYFSGDNRDIANDPRRDRTATGEPLRTPLQQTITINVNRGTVSGTVKNAEPGDPRVHGRDEHQRRLLGFRDPNGQQ
jgi:hypothetical protein